jgi:hypothetical protein
MQVAKEYVFEMHPWQSLPTNLDCSEPSLHQNILHREANRWQSLPRPNAILQLEIFFAYGDPKSDVIA